jgi:hypothetical protein
MAKYEYCTTGYAIDDYGFLSGHQKIDIPNGDGWRMANSVTVSVGSYDHVIIHWEREVVEDKE